jgi:ParB family transcriptional regulator, chromosome partitioning protein
LSYFGILQDISIFKISPASHCLREVASNLEELAESIRQYGLLQPIVVRPKSSGYEIVAGNRRLAAAKLLKLRKLSCHVIELSDKEAYEVGLVENLQHKTMNPIEESIAFKKYVNSYGWGGVSELAKHIGKSQEFVTKRIQLLSLPEEIQQELIRQRITPSVALELLASDKESIPEMGEFVIKNSLTKIEARNLVKNLMNDNVTKNVITKSHDETEEIVKKDLTSYERELYLLDKALMKSITIMKSTLVSFDDVINSVDYNWILKELLMQYRLIIHGDIDTFLKLRKRLKSKMPLNYLSSSRNSKKSYSKAGDYLDKEIVTPIHLGTTFLS